MTENHLRFVIGRHTAAACKRLVSFAYRFSKSNDRRIPRRQTFRSIGRQDPVIFAVSSRLAAAAAASSIRAKGRGRN